MGHNHHVGTTNLCSASPLITRTGDGGSGQCWPFPSHARLQIYAVHGPPGDGNEADHNTTWNVISILHRLPLNSASAIRSSHRTRLNVVTLSKISTNASQLHVWPKKQNMR
jgi:hypothetical protein